MSEMIDRFFKYSRDRENIRIEKDRAFDTEARGPFTDDPILREFRFCNIFREDDVTTAQLRSIIREPLREFPQVLFAVVLFRWFNRQSTAYQLYKDDGLDLFSQFNPTRMRQILRPIYDRGEPITTGSYIIKTPNGMDKLEGLLWCLEQFDTQRAECCEGRRLTWPEFAHHAISTPDMTLQEAHHWLMQFPFMGPFMSYEVVTDLRHTALLDGAPDINSWANAGPGAIRGLNRIYGRPLKSGLRQSQACVEMQELLQLSRLWTNWPWPKRPWELREVEHTLCEFDKYERVRNGEGTPRQRYNPGA